MNVTLRKPAMTRAQFFEWAQAQDGRYEFDGGTPVAMTGGTIGHNKIGRNVLLALGTRLRGHGCQPFGPDAGVATVGDTVRYPDALITCTDAPDDAHVVPGVVVVFEVVSPSSGRMDRIVKVREYQAVASIRRYVLIESGCVGVTVLERQGADARWISHALTAGEMLGLPEVGLEIPVDEFYERVGFADVGDGMGGG